MQGMSRRCVGAAAPSDMPSNRHPRRHADTGMTCAIEPHSPTSDNGGTTFYVRRPNSRRPVRPSRWSVLAPPRTGLRGHVRPALLSGGQQPCHPPERSEHTWAFAMLLPVAVPVSVTLVPFTSTIVIHVMLPSEPWS